MFLLLQGQPSACDLNLLPSFVLWDGSQTNPLPRLFFTLASPTHFPAPRHTWNIPRLSPPGTICPPVLLAASTSQEQPGPTHRLPRFPLYSILGILASAHQCLALSKGPVTPWLLFSSNVLPLRACAACNTSQLLLLHPCLPLGLHTSPFFWVFIHILLFLLLPFHTHDSRLPIDLMARLIVTLFRAKYLLGQGRC